MGDSRIKQTGSSVREQKRNAYFVPFTFIIILGLISSFAIGQVLVRTKYSEVRFTMSLIVKNIEMRLDSATAITELAAEMPCVSEHNSAEAERYLNEIIQKKPSMWSHFLITDKDGIEIAHTEGAVHYGKSLAERNYYFVPWNEGKTKMAQPIHSVSTGRKIIAIGVPTYNNGEANGVLVGFIHLEYVSSLLNENDFSKNSYLFMTNSDGTISAHLNEDYILAKNIEELTGDERLLSKTDSFHSGIGIGELEGRLGLVSSVPTSVHNLFISSFIPFSEAFMSPIIVTSVLLAIFTALIFLVALWIKMEKSVAFGKEMENTANTDKLTGLKNRHWLDAISIETCCEEFLTAIFLDVDNFKRYNDEHNHAYGDDVLKFVGKSLLGSTRPDTDTCIRYAGDEFVILFRDTPTSNAVPIAERLMATLKTYRPGEQLVPIHISCGISSAKKGEMTLEQLIARTDDLAYEAKRSGKNTIVVAGDLQ